MGLRVLLTIPKTFDDFEVISVICFAQDNLESSFTPRYEWPATLESGCPNSEYWCELGFVLFVIGRCTLTAILADPSLFSCSRVFPFSHLSICYCLVVVCHRCQHQRMKKRDRVDKKA